MRRLALAAAALLALLLAGCGAPSPEGASQPRQSVQLLVRDANLRPIDVECAGSGPFLAFHRTAKYRVLDGAGSEIGSGTLPAGRSIQALQEDLEVERVPTFCQFEFGVDLPDRNTYQLAVDGREPLKLIRKGGRLFVAMVP